MNARRPPSAPPEIPGFAYLQLLGSGGFADVFLYEQRMPKRRVAIKVLLSEALTEGARESFDAEANLMAQLSTHPSIVTIYQADISSDGRPYLAMEYCPKPNLGARYRREKISVAEALRIGIQVAGAVETSHRAGILHRDIKPANILVTEYNRPALTDFGISVALVGGGEQESVGMSIPWSPPEVFGSAPASGVAADIYSLGATVYTILAGRSPFEVPGGSNSGLDLIARIQGSPLTRTGRPDVPPSLEEVLATAMAKRESARYGSALEFARALQKVQLELSMSVTPTDVLDEQVDTDEVEEEDEGHTRIRGMVSIDPTGPVRPTTSRPPTSRPPASRPTTPPAAAAHEPVEHTMLRGGSPAAPPRVDSRGFVIDEPALETTMHRPATGPQATEEAPSKRRALPYILGAAALVLLVGIGGLVFALNQGGSPAQQAIEESDEPVDQIDIGETTVESPTELVGTLSPEGATFTWTNPHPEAGDVYAWQVVTPGKESPMFKTDETTAFVPAEEIGAGQVCVDVTIVQVDGDGSQPTTACAE
ncbi:protein kinase [Herbiconiux sp. CPCC 203407]|uniref:non-specific serine/threonine protein kinase n=1 Tax=Herbiconiux oxytropis TaxID=2970915 RepID=A0AA41XEY2_9MICO|nr:serine/threonine-protein kinase [Herbiconiux oxytropis]MCS5720709.1 protein kinase [Herbiconiux oxytropis]MCS5724964.1 protein kinase [Herbiconiux oxytropis]